jgi:hypothetical protein
LNCKLNSNDTMLMCSSNFIEPPGIRLDEGDEAMEESLVQSNTPAQEQDTFLNPVHNSIKKTKLNELYETTSNELTGGVATKKRRTVVEALESKVLGSNPPYTHSTFVRLTKDESEAPPSS